MADQASEFIRQSQAMAEQSWSQWMRYLQQAAGQPASPFAGFGAPGMPGMTGMPGMAASSAPMSDMLERGLSGISSYLEWMQRAANAQASPPGMDWQASVKDFLGGAAQPFAQAFSGIDSTAAQGFVQQWQAWLAAASQAGTTDWRAPAYMPGFGLHREQQAQQQALVAAMMESAEQQRRYQALILKANAQGLERLQDKLADHVEPGRQLESLKALYDLWVDAAEEAYAEIALSDEFREVYGAMVNAQMRERQLVQQHLEDLCRQLGLPTRSEIDSLGRRLQEVRRELRAMEGGGGAAAGELAALRAELQALKRSQHGAAAPAPVAPAAADAAPAKPKRKAKATGTRPVAQATRKKSAGKKAGSAKSPAKASKTGKPAGKTATKPATGSSAPSKDSRKRTALRTRRAAAAVKSSGASRRSLVSPGIPAPHRARRK
nr:poly(R)-hydroxyalkanoic acid synthase subunit PhaE [Dyella ginsengisoli]